MDEKEIQELKEQNLKLEEKVDKLEFKLNLLFENSSISRMLFEYDVTYEQYIKLMDLMDEYRSYIENGDKVSHMGFEKKIYMITDKEGDYHFCESLAKLFMENGRWEEVFPALYGDMQKYKYYMEKRNEEEQL